LDDSKSSRLGRHDDSFTEQLTVHCCDCSANEKHDTGNKALPISRQSQEGYDFQSHAISANGKKTIEQIVDAASQQLKGNLDCTRPGGSGDNAATARLESEEALSNIGAVLDVQSLGEEEPKFVSKALDESIIPQRSSFTRRTRAKSLSSQRCDANAGVQTGSVSRKMFATDLPDGCMAKDHAATNTSSVSGNYPEIPSSTYSSPEDPVRSRSCRSLLLERRSSSLDAVTVPDRKERTVTLDKPPVGKYDSSTVCASFPCTGSSGPQTKDSDNADSKAVLKNSPPSSRLPELKRDGIGTLKIKKPFEHKR